MSASVLTNIPWIPNGFDAGVAPSGVFGNGKSRRSVRGLVVALEPSVTIVVRANPIHALRVVGNQPPVIFGIHTFGKRIVNYLSSPSGTR